MTESRRFLQALEADAALREELRSRHGDAVAPRDLADFASAKGYAVNAEDFAAELSDAQLDSVAGGAYEFYVKVQGTKQGKLA